MRASAAHAIQDLPACFGFHFHPIMGHFAVNDRRLYPLFELISELKVPVMIDVGTTGMGAGMPGGMGAKIRHAHPSGIDELAADFPALTILAAHPGWPWVDEMTAVALHKGNVYWELSGWAPQYFPPQLKKDIRGRLKGQVLFLAAIIPASRTSACCTNGTNSATPMKSRSASSMAMPNAPSGFRVSLGNLVCGAPAFRRASASP